MLKVELVFFLALFNRGIINVKTRLAVIRGQARNNMFQDYTFPILRLRIRPIEVGGGGKVSCSPCHVIIVNP